MARKDDLIKQAADLGPDTPGDVTAPEIETPILPEEDAGAVVALHQNRINRGSRRRMERAMVNLQAAIAAFVSDMDTMVYEADKDGNRVNEWPLITEVKKVSEGIGREVTALMSGEK